MSEDICDETTLAASAAAPSAEVRAILDAAAPFFSVLAARRSVRQFAPGMPPRELIVRAIEGATHAPSGMNKQPWRFVIVANDAVKAEMVARVSREIETILTLLAGDEYADKVAEYLRNYATLFRTPPVVINALHRASRHVIASPLDPSHPPYPT